MGNRRPIPKDFLVTFNTRRRLLPLVLAPFNKLQDRPDQPNFETPCSSANLLGRAVPLHVCLEDRIQNLVRRQRIRIQLLRPQLRRRRLLDRLPRNHPRAPDSHSGSGRRPVTFMTSPITASAPTISPYSVQYPVDISLLLPVVNTSAPNLFDSAINSVPRILGCRFSSASPNSVPCKQRLQDTS